MTAALVKLARRIRPSSMVVAWTQLSAVLFLAGAAQAIIAGAALFAKMGVLSAATVIAVVAAFSG